MSMVHYLIFAPGAGCVGRPPTSSSNAIVTPHNCHGLGSGDSSHSRGDSSSKSGVEAPRNSLDLDADNPNDIQVGHSSCSSLPLLLLIASSISNCDIINC
jgi:hypothetical protein